MENKIYRDIFIHCYLCTFQFQKVFCFIMTIGVVRQNSYYLKTDNYAVTEKYIFTLILMYL